MNRNLLIIILVIVLLLLLFLGARHHSKFHCDGAPPAKTEQVKEKVKKAAPIAAAAAAKSGIGLWPINDGSLLSHTSDKWYRFNRDNFAHLPVKDKTLTAGISKTVKHLKDNPARMLTIVGMYEKGERNTSALPDLGLARANSVKNSLVAAGVNPGQLELASKVVGKTAWNGNMLMTGVDFKFDKLTQNTSRLDAIKKRLFGKPITLYFPTGQDAINLKSSQRTDFADIIYYLDKVKTSKLEISGHTDNVGSRAGNVKLSKGRAEFAAQYLQRNGISKSKMASVGFGPDKPIATNNTAEGKSKNRRVEVLLK